MVTVRQRFGVRIKEIPWWSQLQEKRLERALLSLSSPGAASSACKTPHTTVLHERHSPPTPLQRPQPHLSGRLQGVSGQLLCSSRLAYSIRAGCHHHLCLSRARCPLRAVWMAKAAKQEPPLTSERVPWLTGTEPSLPNAVSLLPQHNTDTTSDHRELCSRDHSPRKGTPACLASSSPPPLEKMFVHS